MNFIDILLLIFLAWGVIQGFQRGLVHEVAGLAALILGIFGAIHFSDFTAGLLMEHLNMQGRYLHLVAFAITFVGIVIAVHFIANIIDKLVKVVALGFVNRITGMVFGVLKMALILSVILVILNIIDRRTPFLPEEKIQESFLYQPISGLAPLLFARLKIENMDIPRPRKPDNKDKGIEL
jgi:membrane protein required for colicin V production